MKNYINTKTTSTSADKLVNPGGEHSSMVTSRAVMVSGLWYICFHLDGVVESFKDADTLGAELQVDQALHAQRDAMMVQRLPTHQHDDAWHHFLHTHKKLTAALSACQQL